MQDPNEVDVEAVIATGADAVFGYKNYTTEDQIAADSYPEVTYDVAEGADVVVTPEDISIENPAAFLLM